MLGSRDDLQVARVIPLQATDERGTDLTAQERVLPIGLGRPAPAGVSGHVDRRRPEGQHIAVQLLLKPALVQLVPAGARLIGNGRGHGLDQLRVPGGRQADGLREHGETPRPHNPVQSLVAVVILRESQTLIGRRSSPEQVDLLLEGHPAQQILHPVRHRRTFILVQRNLGAYWDSQKGGKGQ